MDSAILPIPPLGKYKEEIQWEDIDSILGNPYTRVPTELDEITYFDLIGLF